MEKFQLIILEATLSRFLMWLREQFLDVFNYDFLLHILKRSLTLCSHPPYFNHAIQKSKLLKNKYQSVPCRELAFSQTKSRMYSSVDLYTQLMGTHLYLDGHLLVIVLIIIRITSYALDFILVYMEGGIIEE